MHSRVTYFLLVVCTVQVLATDRGKFNHEICIKDTKSAIELYDEQLKQFYKVQDEIWKEKKDTVKKLQSSAEKKVCQDLVERLKSITDNLNEDVCEIFVAGDIFDGPWKSKQNLSKQEICEFIATYGPIVDAILEHNKHVSTKCRNVLNGTALKDTCNVKGTEFNADRVIIIIVIRER